MESARTRRLTTRLVVVGLSLGIGCLLVGLGLGFFRPLPRGAVVLPYRALGPALLAGEPQAWLSLGVLLLIVTPSLRMLGMVLTFRAEKNKRALVSGLVVLTILVASLLGPLFERGAPGAAPPGAGVAPQTSGGR